MAGSRRDRGPWLVYLYTRGATLEGGGGPRAIHGPMERELAVKLAAAISAAELRTADEQVIDATPVPLNPGSGVPDGVNAFAHRWPRQRVRVEALVAELRLLMNPSYEEPESEGAEPETPPVELDR